MFLHIGADTEIRVKDIVGILDIKSLMTSKTAQSFLNIVQNEDLHKLISKEIKSVIITEENGKSLFYFSPISSVALQKRISHYQTGF